MITRYQRRDNSVKQRHKDVGLVVQAKQANRRERHNVRVSLVAEAIEVVSEARFEGILDRLIAQLCAEAGV